MLLPDGFLNELTNSYHSGVISDMLRSYSIANDCGVGDELPETVIEITIQANGKVSAARVVRSSGNRSMEASVQALLSHLDLLPRPPEGSITFRVTLKTR